MSDEHDLRTQLRDLFTNDRPVTQQEACAVAQRRRHVHQLASIAAAVVIAAAIALPLTLGGSNHAQRVQVGTPPQPAPSSSVPVPASPPSSQSVGGATGISAVRVPDVLGDTPAMASAQIGAGGLAVNPTLAQVVNAEIPAGRIAGEIPPAGALVAPGTAITLYVSTGKASPTAPSVTVPDLSGQLRSAAVATLSAAGLKAAIAFSPSDTVPVGTVAGESPSAGQAVPPGSTVFVFVSSGPHSRGVPYPGTIPGAATPTTSTTVQSTTTTSRVR